MRVEPTPEAFCLLNTRNTFQRCSTLVDSENAIIVT